MQVSICCARTPGWRDGPSASCWPGESKSMPREGWRGASTKDNTERLYLHKACMCHACSFLGWASRFVQLSCMLFCLCSRTQLISATPGVLDVSATATIDSECIRSGALVLRRKLHKECLRSFNQAHSCASLCHRQLVTTLTGICALEIWFSLKALRPEIIRESLCDCIVLL